MAELDRLDDDELLVLTPKRPEAFGVFYERHVRAVLAHVRRSGLSVEEALDLTAEVFAAALLASRRFRPGGAPARAWLFGIVRNQLAARHRKNAVEVSARRKLGMPRLTFTDEALERVEDRDAAAAGGYLNGAAELPPAERHAVLAHVVDGRGYEEIAAATASTPAAVRQRVSRGLAKLRKAADR